jgi:prolyl-tRNA synthetase
MKDAYSFDKDEAGLDKNYKAMYDAYIRIFKRCGLDVLITEADPGVMGGKVSHEFMVRAKGGEDIVLLCPKCNSAKTFSRPAIEEKAGSRIAGKEGEKENCVKCHAKSDRINTIEVGHIFKLGTKYTSSLSANFLDCTGKLKPIIMGCYGIGVSRLIAAIIEQNYDLDGIIWPKEIAPYKVIILSLDASDKKITELAYGLYKELQQMCIDTLLDDRDERSGVKFKDADLLGIPLQVVIGKESLKDDVIELKVRRTHEKIIKKKSEIYKEIDRLISG